MLDSRILARLVDPAALRPEPELATTEIAAALRAFLDATQPDLFPTPAEPPADEEQALAPPGAGPLLNALGLSETETRTASTGADLEAEPRPALPELAAGRNAVGKLDLDSILLPSAPLVTLPANPPSAAMEDARPELSALADHPFAPGGGWVRQHGTESDQSQIKTLAEAWGQGPSLIEPATLLPAADPPPTSRTGPDLDAARGPGLAAANQAVPAWPNLSGSIAPRGLAEPHSAGALSDPAVAGSLSDPAGEAMTTLAPRLVQAVGRLEAAAEQLARLAGRSSSIALRPFRGRLAD
jgi:hypothetical protein